MLLNPNSQCQELWLCIKKQTYLQIQSVSQFSFDLVVKDGLFIVQESTESSADIQKSKWSTVGGQIVEERRKKKKSKMWSGDMHFLLNYLWDLSRGRLCSSQTDWSQGNPRQEHRQEEELTESVSIFSVLKGVL